MEDLRLRPRYYGVNQIKQLENCGRDRAYEIAKKLPHEIRGRAYYVFAEDYDNYYNEKRKMVLNDNETPKQDNVYQIRRFN